LTRPKKTAGDVPRNVSKIATKTGVKKKKKTPTTAQGGGWVLKGDNDQKGGVILSVGGGGGNKTLERGRRGKFSNEIFVEKKKRGGKHAKGRQRGKEEKKRLDTK